MRRTAWIPILTIVLLAAAVPAGAIEENVGAVVQPGFDAAREAGNESAKLAPDETEPVFDAYLRVVDRLEEISYTIVVGLENGSAGSDAESPEEVGVRLDSIEVSYNASVPGTSIDVPSQEITVETPAVNETIETPPVETPGPNETVPGEDVNGTIPGVTVPGASVHVPGQNVSTGPIEAPPVNVTIPGIEVPSQNVTIDVGNSTLTIQEVNGTLYVAGQKVPIHVEEHTIRLGDVLPEPVPDEVTVERGLVNTSEQTIGREGEQLHEGVNASTPPVTVSRNETNLTDPVHVGNASAGPTQVNVSEQRVADEQEVHVGQESVRVGEARTPGLEASTEPVHIDDGTVATPPVNASVDAPGPVEVGYTGWGEDDDASTYPFACAASHCLPTEVLLEPFVGFVDRCLDRATDELSGSVIAPEILFGLTAGCFAPYPT